jgi:RNA polymerase sigma-70 factor, ECF subfamily
MVVILFRPLRPDVNRQSFDAEYVQRLGEGDPATERDFFGYFGELILIKARARGLSHALAEDARQETFLRVLRTLRAPGGLRCAEALGAFVNGVCNNVLKERFRERKRHEPADEPTPQPDTATPSPEARLLTLERQQAVRRVIERMSADNARLLRAIVLQERERHEVCGELGVSPDYLRVLLHRAKREFLDLYLKSEAPPASAACTDSEIPPSPDGGTTKARGSQPPVRSSRAERGSAGRTVGL